MFARTTNIQTHNIHQYTVSYKCTRTMSILIVHASVSMNTHCRVVEKDLHLWQVIQRSYKNPWSQGTGHAGFMESRSQYQMLNHPFCMPIFRTTFLMSKAELHKGGEEHRWQLEDSDHRQGWAPWLSLESTRVTATWKYTEIQYQSSLQPGLVQMVWP